MIDARVFATIDRLMLARAIRADRYSETLGGRSPSIMACTADAENGVPRLDTWPISASSRLILRNDRRLPLSGQRAFAYLRTSSAANIGSDRCATQALGLEHDFRAGFGVRLATLDLVARGAWRTRPLAPSSRGRGGPVNALWTAKSPPGCQVRRAAGIQRADGIRFKALKALQAKLVRVQS
jgi:hypothetical protein